ncbi:MAG: VanW family protein [Thermofilaceae archaeon]
MRGVWIAVLVAYLVGTLGLAWLMSEPQGVMQGVYIGNTHVGSWSRQQLRHWCREQAKQLTARPVDVFVAGRQWSMQPSELGVEFTPDSAEARAWLAGREPTLMKRLVSRLKALNHDVAASFSVWIDETQLKHVLKRFESPPQNASVELIDGQVRVLPGQPGITIPLKDAVLALKEVLGRGERSVFLPARLTMPVLSQEHLAGITLRVVVSVPITSNHPGALQNARLAVRTLNKAIVLPGQTLSLNQLLGERTPAKGYTSAPVLINERRDLGVGGGICVVSTAIFQAAALAGLEITERHPHAYPMRYANPGLDATLNYPNKDLKIKNPTDKPIVLRLYIKHRRVVVHVFGASLETPIRLDTKRKRQGKWLKVDTFRVQNGQRQFLCRSSYRL